MQEADDNDAVDTPDIFDSYINMEVRLPRVNDGELYHATVKRRAIDDNGKPLGVEKYNPITDTRLYEVEYLDGTIKNLALSSYLRTCCLRLIMKVTVNSLLMR